MNAASKLEDHRRLFGWLSRLYFMTPTYKDIVELDLLSLDVIDIGFEELKAMDKIIKGMDATAVKAVAVDYTNLFCGFRNDAPFPYESIYRGEQRLLMQKPYSEVKAAYEEGGYEPKQEGGNELADHITFELQYLSFLLGKAAEALENEDEDKAIYYLDQKDFFLDEHMQRWIPVFCKEIKEQSDTEFFRTTSALTESALNAVARL